MFFVATTLIEVGAALGLIAVPGLSLWVLLGLESPGSETLVVGRITGAALLALGLASWFAREDRGSRSQHGLLWGLLLYNSAACLMLAWAGAMLQMSGLALWPVVVLHVGMTAWCAVTLRARTSTSR